MKSLLLLLILPVVLCVEEKLVCEVNSRILGGEYAEEGEFPELVFLMEMVWYWDSNELKLGNYTCAGSVISEYWVLTAAHCISPQPPTKFISVRVHPAKGNPLFIESHTVFTHSEYPYPADIALIRLPQPISNIHPNFKPVSLPLQGQELTSNEVTLVGWGLISTTEQILASKLMKLEHVQLNQSLCQYLGGSEDELLCRSPTEKTGTTCKGDSGGPIFMDGLQVGVVSGEFPAPFTDFLIKRHTRVSAYRKWIDAQIRLYTS